MIVFRNKSLNCPSFPNASCSRPATPAPPLQPSTLKRAAVVELILPFSRWRTIGADTCRQWDAQMNHRYAEAPTVIEAANKVLGRPLRVDPPPAKAKFSHDFLEQSLIEQLLTHKGKIGALDFVQTVSRGRTLFLGEGNLSFSLALAKLKPSAAKDFTATTFEPARRLPSAALLNASQLTRMGAKVLNGIDATRLQAHFGTSKFHAIIFNFPNVASRMPIYGRNPNHILVRKFLSSAAGQLVRGGLVVMTVVDSSFYAGEFGLPAAARFSGFGEPEIHEFKPSRFPGYVHANTLGGQSALTKYRAFSTWVFRLP